MKYGRFRGVDFSIGHTHSYGRYVITATYHGKEVKAYTTNSMAYDYVDDDSDQAEYNAARRHCYNCIRDAYQNRL